MYMYVCASLLEGEYAAADAAALRVAERPKDLWAGRGYAAADSAVFASRRNRNGGFGAVPAACRTGAR
jgi:hypothetical protein